MLKPNFYTNKIDVGEEYGKFILEPLRESFGHSLGIILRRTLLSSLRGAAITQVKVEGSSHLFSTVKGIKESVLEIVLNLKQLRFKTSGDGPFKVSLTVKGVGKKYGKDVKGEVEVANKDLYLLEVTDPKVNLQIEAIVEVGYGHLFVEERESNETGYIPVNAFFSPVTKVNFKVEAARLGRKLNHDRLIIEVWTDGTINPEKALREVSLLLSNYFSYILSGQDVPQVKEEESEASKESDLDKKLSEIIIDELSLPSRVINALLREHIETVVDLVKVGPEKLKTMKGVGKKSIELIKKELAKMRVELE